MMMWSLLLPATYLAYCPGLNDNRKIQPYYRHWGRGGEPNDDVEPPVACYLPGILYKYRVE
jgi:hypothetical protein